MQVKELQSFINEFFKRNIAVDQASIVLSHLRSIKRYRRLLKNVENQNSKCRLYLGCIKWRYESIVKILKSIETDVEVPVLLPCQCDIHYLYKNKPIKKIPMVDKVFICIPRIPYRDEMFLKVEGDTIEISTTTKTISIDIHTEKVKER